MAISLAGLPALPPPPPSKKIDRSLSLKVSSSVIAFKYLDFI